VWRAQDPLDSKWYIYYAFLQQHFSVSPNPVDFDQILEGSSREQIVFVENDGKGDIDIGNIAVQDTLDSPFYILNEDCSGRTLSPRESCTITILFSETAIDSFNDTFDIPSNDNEPITVEVKGAYIENLDNDNDGVLNVDDNCPNYYNPNQNNLDGDELGDGCDSDADGDGYDAITASGTDCDDRNISIYPGATEVCNGEDDNCNGQIDENINNTAIFAADFGRANCSNDCGGDFEPDGDVDGSDLATFAANFDSIGCLTSD
jgi:hypothetical protein